ncbi:MAG: hypothetical protein ACYDEJ_13455 [Desulfitobacteriaceae bacterium]
MQQAEAMAVMNSIIVSDIFRSINFIKVFQWVFKL